MCDARRLLAEPPRSSSGPLCDVSDAACFFCIFFSSRLCFSSSNLALVCLWRRPQDPWINGLMRDMHATSSLPRVRVRARSASRRAHVRVRANPGTARAPA